MSTLKRTRPGETLRLPVWFFSSRRRHTRYWRDWSSYVCSSDLELVRARLQHDVYLRAARAAESGVVGRGKRLELAYGVHGRAHAERVELRVYVVDAVEQEVVRVLARAVYGEGEVAAHRPGGALRGRRRAGDEQTQLVEVAPVEREALDLPVLDDHPERGRVLLRQRLIGHVHRDLIAARGRGEVGVHPPLLVDQHLQPAVFGGEPLRLEPQEVGSGHQRRDRKSTRLNSSHANISYAVFCLKKIHHTHQRCRTSPARIVRP